MTARRPVQNDVYQHQFLSKAEADDKIALVKEHIWFCLDPHVRDVFMADDVIGPTQAEWTLPREQKGSSHNITFLSDEFLASHLPHSISSAYGAITITSRSRRSCRFHVVAERISTFETVHEPCLESCYV